MSRFPVLTKVPVFPDVVTSAAGLEEGPDPEAAGGEEP